MSHFAVYECNVSNVDFIKASLSDMGLSYKENATIIDYYGQKRLADLAVVSDEKLLPLGWVRNKKGDLDLQADWFKVPMSEKQFTSKVSQLHSKYQVIQTCEENRWTVNFEDIHFNQEGEIEILATTFA